VKSLTRLRLLHSEPQDGMDLASQHSDHIIHRQHYSLWPATSPVTAKQVAKG